MEVEHPLPGAVAEVVEPTGPRRGVPGVSGYGTPGECIYCGRYSTQLVAGVCPGCRRKGRSIRLLTLPGVAQPEQAAEAERRE